MVSGASQVDVGAGERHDLARQPGAQVAAELALRPEYGDLFMRDSEESN